MSLVMSLRSRGGSGSAARAGKVLTRFGATAGAMVRRLDRYDAITSELGIRPTWPTTASVLARHPDLLRRYAEQGVELALHGLVHGDHGGLDEAQQREAIARAADIFDRSGLQATGFRGPYLRYNAATLNVLRELGLRYHSSQAVVYPLCGEADGARQTAYALALELYSARDARRIAVTPRLRSGLVDIPVSIPDDEILIERLRLDEAAQTAQWLSVLEETYRRGDLFTVQLHPERITELGGAPGHLGGGSKAAARCVHSDARRDRVVVAASKPRDPASAAHRRRPLPRAARCRSRDDPAGARAQRPAHRVVRPGRDRRRAGFRGRCASCPNRRRLASNPVGGTAIPGRGRPAPRSERRVGVVRGLRRCLGRGLDRGVRPGCR